jgi:murein DD-endopeptidase MepM/ murein hydrolase activator NlpD
MKYFKQQLINQCILIISILISNANFAQIANFRSPMDVPLIVTAAFCEIRPNHFHSGLDFSTYGKSLPVFACEDGFVSRIRVSAYGYGLSLYIEHPNGYKTVYGHLNRFNDTLNKWIENKQITNQKFEIDETLSTNQFAVKKGDLVAYSGNTGTSTAPHLHFEIRDQKLDLNHNPKNFNLPITDVLKPTIKGFYAFSLKDFGRVDGEIGMKAINKTIKVKNKPPVIKESEVSGWVAFGFEGFDAIGKKGSKSQPYDIQLDVDGKTVYQVQFETFSFADTRWVNAFYNYPYYLKTKKKVHVCFSPPSAELSIYKKLDNRGFYFFNDTNHHIIKLIVKDVAGNEVSKEIKVKSKPYLARAQITKPNATTFIPGKPFQLKQGNWTIHLGKSSLFDTTQLKINVQKATAYQTANIVAENYYWQAVNNDFKLKVLSKDLTQNQKSKTGFYHVQKRKFLIGSWNGDTLIAQITELGTYQMKSDTIKPTIKFKSFSKKNKTATFLANDALSGIIDYYFRLNGIWYLTTHNGKSNRFTVVLPQNINASNAPYEFEVLDKMGNKAILKGKLLSK